MTTSSTVQIVSKTSHATQHLIPISATTLPPLPPASIRVRSTILGLSSNNLSYARMGSFLKFWDAYPVPASAPTPYNDISQYGIVPAWGFATVLESSIDEIAEGSLIHGYWPLSTLPVDLQLVPAKVSGHWFDRSPHRQSLMPLYNRYVVDSRKTPPLLADKKDPLVAELGWEASVRVIWSCGHLLNSYVFPSDNSLKPIHPFGTDLPWSKESSDLSNTIVICLSASTKTGLGTTDQLIHNRAHGTGPLALLAVASRPDNEALCLDGASFPTKAVTYADATTEETKTWITNLATKSTRALVLDFGGRGTSGADIHSMLSELGMSITTVAIGSEAKVYTPEELAASRAEFARLNKVQSNASGQREATMAQIGEERYFNEMWNEWTKFMERGGFPGMTMSWKESMKGENGVEGVWKNLCQGSVDGRENIVVRL